jgi:hypothetical protein
MADVGQMAVLSRWLFVLMADISQMTVLSRRAYSLKTAAWPKPSR